MRIAATAAAGGSWRAALGLQRDAALAGGRRLEVRVLLRLVDSSLRRRRGTPRTVPEWRSPLLPHLARALPAAQVLVAQAGRRRAAHLVARHAPPGGLVLDPFCGSGVAVVEAAVAGRAALGHRRQPVRRRAGPRHRWRRVDPGRAARQRGRAVLAAAQAEEGAWHRTRCRRCGGDARARRAPRAPAPRSSPCCVRCPRCGGTRREEPTRADLRLARAAPTRRRRRRAAPAGVPRLADPQAAARRAGRLRRALHAAQPARARRDPPRDPGRAARPGARPAAARADRRAGAGLADDGRPLGRAAAARRGRSTSTGCRRAASSSTRSAAFANRLARVVAAKRETEQLLASAPRRAGRARRARRRARRCAAHLPAGERRVRVRRPAVRRRGHPVRRAVRAVVRLARAAAAARPRGRDRRQPACRGAAGRTTPPASPAAFRAVREAIEPGGVLTVTFASREAPAWRALGRRAGGAALPRRGGRAAPAVGAGADRADVAARHAQRRLAALRPPRSVRLRAVEWFHVAEMEPGVHVAEPGHVCSWLIHGSERTILLDTGLGVVGVAASVAPAPAARRSRSCRPRRAAPPSTWRQPVRCDIRGASS